MTLENTSTPWIFRNERRSQGEEQTQTSGLCKVEK
jgi:hypothetical protein